MGKVHLKKQPKAPPIRVRSEMARVAYERKGGPIRPVKRTRGDTLRAALREQL